MGEPKDPHFYDFRFFGPVPVPHNHLFLSLDSKNVNFEKDGHRKMMKGSSNKISKILDVRSTSIKKHEMESW